MVSCNQNAYSEFNYDNEYLNLDDLESSYEKILKEKLENIDILKEEMEKIGEPENLVKVISDEIWSQFANQIGLDITDKTLIQKYDDKHTETYEDISKKIMQDKKFIEKNKNMKKEHEKGELIDTYTGKVIGVNDKPNLDHVVSRKEIFENRSRKQANIDTKDLANKQENLVPTNESLNKSKKEKSVKNFLNTKEEREKDLIKQNEAAHKKINESNKSDLEKRIEHEKIDKRLNDKLDANPELMNEADKKARNSIDKDIKIGQAKEIAKEASLDALKMIAVSALFELLKSIMNGLIRFFKEKHKSFNLFLSEMKESIRKFISRLSNFFEVGLSSLIGTVISEIFDSIASTFKKFVSLIKQSVKSIIDAFKYLTDEKNKDEPLGIKIAQIGKIIIAGLLSAGAIFGGELIEKLLMNIPFMNITIPFIGSLANITGLFLSSLISGIIGAIIINSIDHYITNIIKNENLSKQIDNKNEILEIQYNLIDIKFQKLDNIEEYVTDSITNRHSKAEKNIKESLNTIFKEYPNDDIVTDNIEKLKNYKNEIDNLLK